MNYLFHMRCFSASCVLIVAILETILAAGTIDRNEADRCLQQWNGCRARCTRHINNQIAHPAGFYSEAHRRLRVSYWSQCNAECRWDLDFCVTLAQYENIPLPPNGNRWGGGGGSGGNREIFPDTGGVWSIMPYSY